MLKNLRKASMILPLFSFLLLQSVLAFIDAKCRHLQVPARDFPDARIAAAIRVPARAPPAVYPRPLGQAGQHGTQARTAALSRAVLTRIAKQVRATLSDAPCRPTLSRTPTPESPRLPSLCVGKSARKSAHSYQPSTQVRTHVETARPPSENSPLALPNTLCALASSPDVRFI